MNDFRKKVLKIGEPRKHKVNNSLGVYDAYKFLRKRKWIDIGRALTEHEFYSIIRQVNNLLADNILLGEEVVLPHRMGRLELRKYNTKVSIDNGKLVANLPIDWDRTLKLWAEDKEAYKDKILIKIEDKEVFKIFYNKKTANYENKSFMLYEPNRDLKRRLKQRIKDKAVDAFKLYG